MIDNPNSNMVESVQPVGTPVPKVATPAVPAAFNPSITYANFGYRFIAFFIDGIILGVVNFFIRFIGSLATLAIPKQSREGLVLTTFFMLLINLVCLAINVFYYIYFIGKEGQTLGKKAMKIKVVKADSFEAPGYTTAFLRETIGKFISSIFLGLGYLWMLWDDKKQTWHDKIAGTIVVKIL